MAKPLFPDITGITGLGQTALSRDHSFTPYQPPPIPSGYYDPALDAQRDAASRGLLNNEQDIGLAGRRSQEDLTFDTGQIEQGYTRGLQDLTTGRDRGIEDLGYARSDEGVDYGRNIEALTRSYGQLGRRQAEQARKYGVTSSGIALLSAAKRNENQALERRDIDTGHERATRGFDVAGRRIGEDFSTGSGRLGEDRTTALGRTSQLYDRGVADRGTALSRARSEDTFFGLDVGQQKQYQAQQAGYDAPTGPANEFTRPDGTVVRTIRRGGDVYVYDQTGKLVEKRKAA